MPLDLPQRVVVITGASSGIGLSAALAFAKEGARLVVAARTQLTLERVAASCRRMGAQAIAVPTDVTNPLQIKHLVEETLRRFGQIDVWINNAGVGTFGKLEETPLEAVEQVVKVNLMGYLYAARAVIPVFRLQQRGTMINNISLGAWTPLPYSVPYTATKFGLHGMTRALRGEVSDLKHVHICALYPAVVDTRGFVHAGNYSGHELKVPPPKLSPDRVARTMVRLARRPRAETTLGATSFLARVGEFLMPNTLTAGIAAIFRTYFRRSRAVPPTDGTLFTSLNF
jgi:short-subunit dehydrogenase